MVWHYIANDNYSIKSNYQTDFSQVNISKCNPASSSSAPDESFWKRIWSIQAPQKLRSFMWKMYLNSLATKDNLFRRICPPTSICLIFQGKEEIIEHMIFECLWTRPVWFSSSLALTPPLHASHTIFQWLSLLLSMMKSKKKNYSFSQALYFWADQFGWREIGLSLNILRYISFRWISIFTRKVWSWFLYLYQKITLYVGLILLRQM